MLPSPLPDDPRKWEGWNLYSSPNLYERLGLDFAATPSNEQIEENTRLLLVWWQKKLPLKNQPSNPLAQLLRGGMDTAPKFLAEARAELLNPERRKQIDARLQDQRRVNAINEFKKFLDFALTDKVLTADAEANLAKLGHDMGLSGGDIAGTIAIGLKRTGAVREADLPPRPEPPPPAEPPPAPVPVTAAPPAPAARQTTRATPLTAARPAAPHETTRIRRSRPPTPRDDFERMLRLSGLDEESMTDERRDTFIDMAENMGLDPGEAEDIVDEYLEAIADGTLQATVAPSSPMAADRVVSSPPKPKAPARPAGMVPAPARPGAPPPINPAGPMVSAKITDSVALPKDIGAVAENSRFPDFDNTVGTKMLFLPSATFTMGSGAPGAAANEQPTMRVSLGRFYMARYPITNAEYEKFDPAHRSRRGSWADERHPVIYVSHQDAVKFCQWLSVKERRRYRLPTEAEWEYAAKGTTDSTYPWGETTGLGTLANFADANTTFPWRDASVNDGYAETAPVGSYPEGVSFCGVEDLSGNVWEWCLDYYDAYKGGERTNPRGPAHGSQRVYRGGSWKSRFGNLKTTARGYNQPAYASNDVGFRIVCECD